MFGLRESDVCIMEDNEVSEGVKKEIVGAFVVFLFIVIFV